MAFYFEKEATTSTPYVLADEARSYVRIEGRSFHADVIAFFKEIIDWLDVYLKTDFRTFTFDCEMSYFNSSTSKLLQNIFAKMDKRAAQGKEITVNWIVSSDNEIIIECGQDYMEDAENLRFNLYIKDRL